MEHTLQVVSDERALWNLATGMALNQVRSKGSKLQYASVYRQWERYCEEHGHALLNLMPPRQSNAHVPSIENFLLQVDSTSGRTGRFSALKHVAKALALHFMNDDRVYGSVEKMVTALSFYKIPTGDSDFNPIVLTLAQMLEMIRLHPVKTLRHRRDKAVIALLVATGARRSEVGINTFRNLSSALKWRDFDGEMTSIKLASKGKGGKKEYVGILITECAEVLQAWQAEHVSETWVFPQILGKDGDKVKDAPIGDETIYRIVKQASNLIGVNLSPHGLRRSFITVALTTAGMPLEEVQRQARHASPAVTSRYFYSQGATERAMRWREKFR